MICEHCGYSVHDVDSYTGNEFLYCSIYNDKCISLIPDKCMFAQKRSHCKYFNMNDGTCPKKCALCLFVNPEKDCDEYARKDVLATKDMYQSYQSFVTKCLNKTYERKEEKMGEKCNNRVYLKINDDYVPFESLAEIDLTDATFVIDQRALGGYISCAPRQITPRKVIFSGPKTIVIWEDGTKTIVGCADGQEYDEYAGFCAALAKKIFGSTSAAKRAMGTHKTVNTPKELTQKEDIDYEAIKHQITENLRNTLRDCLNSISLMDFQKKIDDISSKAFDSEKEDDKND